MSQPRASDERESAAVAAIIGRMPKSCVSGCQTEVKSVGPLIKSPSAAQKVIKTKTVASSAVT